MIDIAVSNQWGQTFPGAHIGILLMGNVDNRKRSTPLDEQKKDLVSSLRSKYEGYSRADLLETKVLRAYKAYYRNFGKTYHIQLQLESILHKGKSLPNVSPLVDANFAAERGRLYHHLWPGPADSDLSPHPAGVICNICTPWY